MAKKVFVVQSSDPEFEAVYTLIKDAVGIASRALDRQVIEVFGSKESMWRLAIEPPYDKLGDVDLVICDITSMTSSVMYELGYAHGIKKPIIFIKKMPDYGPVDIRTAHILFYHHVDLKDNIEFVHGLAISIGDALANPLAYITRPSAEAAVNTVFISYSHQDRTFLDRLMVHLRPLEKEGLIDPWVDTRLQAGDKWKSEVESALNKARVAILMVTADFLASDFIVDNELPPILSNAESKGTRVIPVILKPCRFTRDKHLSRFQAINDPNSPLSTLPESKQESIYDSISEVVERLLLRQKL